jgi:hypothetical protein
MDTNRRTAVIVGVLFIIATVVLLIGNAIYAPILESDDYLNDAYPDRSIAAAGVLIEFIAILAIPLIAVYLFPILKARNETLALGYVVFRTVEAVFLLAAGVALLSLIDLSQDYLDSSGGATSFQNIGSSVKSLSEWSFSIAIVVFGLDALMLYPMLYSARLVPRFISGWGAAAALLLLVGTVVSLLDLVTGTAWEASIAGPIAVNEMVLAGWLIVKGFDTSAPVFEPSLVDAT